MDKLEFEDGELVERAYIEIDGEKYYVTPSKYTGKTPFSSFVLNELQKRIEDEIESLKTKLEESTKIGREILFNEPNNELSVITLDKSIYDYRYLYIRGESSTYEVTVPIYSNSQTSFRDTNGWAGNSNQGTVHIQGTISNSGKTLTISNFKSIIHNSSSDHSTSYDHNVCIVYGVR